jgi:hypothetical protein
MLQYLGETPENGFHNRCKQNFKFRNRNVCPRLDRVERRDSKKTNIN